MLRGAMTPPSDSRNSVGKSAITLLRKAGGALRDLWLMIGITLIMFLGLEGLYRAQAAIRSDRPTQSRKVVDSTLHPYANEAWWGPFQGKEGHGVRDNHFDPYRGHMASPASSRYVNIDSAGRRITPQAPASGSRVRQVYMLGGSTMWGYTARDSFTIPALVAKELHARGVTDVEVVNLAQVGYNTTQDAITLLLELANGRAPAAVVALDGFNDIATATEYGGAGRSYDETALSRLIKRGRRSPWEEVAGLGQNSALIMGLRKKLGLEPSVEAHKPPADTLCAEVARYYHGIVRATEGMGRASGFPVIHMLQPFHSASHKALTPWEQTLRPQPVYAQCAAAIETEMARDPAGLRFVSLTGVFDDDSTSAFADEFSHVTEAASRRIAARIASELVPLLTGQGPAAP